MLKGATSLSHSDSAGPHPSDNNALKLRHVEKEQGECVPWVAGCICFGVGAWQPHSLHRERSSTRGTCSGVRFRNVLSAKRYIKSRARTAAFYDGISWGGVLEQESKYLYWRLRCNG